MSRWPRFPSSPTMGGRTFHPCGNGGAWTGGRTCPGNGGISRIGIADDDAGPPSIPCSGTALCAWIVRLASGASSSPSAAKAKYKCKMDRPLDEARQQHPND